MKLITVVAASLRDDRRRVLVTERPEGKSLAGLWEFPGGKIEPGETPEAALVRELHEELGIRVAESDLQAVTFVSHTYPDFHLLMLLYEAWRWQGDIHPHDGQRWQWVTLDALANLPMPPADVPLVQALQAREH